MLRKITLMAVLFCLTFQLSCAPTPHPSLKIGKAYAIDGQTYVPQIQPDYKQVGYASWYGSHFHKKRTANGEVFDKEEYTAAHKTLPLPSIVRVTNLDNGRSILVRINDRGPFVRGRIIDVSENAAKALGFYGKGTAHVEVELDKAASLLLLNDPTLKIREAEKKLILEAYLKDMPSSKQSQPSQSINTLVPQTETPTEPYNEPITLNQTDEKIHPEQERLEKAAVVQTAAIKQQAQEAGVPKKYYANKKIAPTTPPKISQQKMSKTGKAIKAPRAKNSKANTAQPVSSQQVNPPAISSQKTPPPVQLNQPQPIQTPQTQPQPLQQKSTTANVNANQPQALQPQTQALKPHQQPANNSVAKTGSYKIQIASTPSEAEAKKISLSLKNLTSQIEKANVNGKVYFRVRVNGFTSKTDAEKTLNSLKSKGYKDAFIF